MDKSPQTAKGQDHDRKVLRATLKAAQEGCALRRLESEKESKRVEELKRKGKFKQIHKEHRNKAIKARKAVHEARQYDGKSRPSQLVLPEAENDVLEAMGHGNKRRSFHFGSPEAEKRLEEIKSRLLSSDDNTSFILKDL